MKDAENGCLIFYLIPNCFGHEIVRCKSNDFYITLNLILMLPFV